MKNVSIFIPGAVHDDYDVVKEVTMWPGTNVRTVLGESGLDEYQLRTQDGQFLSETDNIYDMTSQGQKLFAVLKMDVGF